MDEKKKKTMHINLYGQRVRDYEEVREFYGIMNDNDLVRFLFASAANRIRDKVASENSEAD